MDAKWPEVNERGFRLSWHTFFDAWWPTHLFCLVVYIYRIETIAALRVFCTRALRDLVHVNTICDACQMPLKSTTNFSAPQHNTHCATNFEFPTRRQSIVRFSNDPPTIALICKKERAKLIKYTLLLLLHIF